MSSSSHTRQNTQRYINDSPLLPWPNLTDLKGHWRSHLLRSTSSEKSIYIIYQYRFSSNRRIKSSFLYFKKIKPPVFVSHHSTQCQTEFVASPLALKHYYSSSQCSFPMPSSRMAKASLHPFQQPPFRSSPTVTIVHSLLVVHQQHLLSIIGSRNPISCNIAWSPSSPTSWAMAKVKYSLFYDDRSDVFPVLARETTTLCPVTSSKSSCLSVVARRQRFALRQRSTWFIGNSRMRNTEWVASLMTDVIFYLSVVARRQRSALRQRSTWSMLNPRIRNTEVMRGSLVDIVYCLFADGWGRQFAVIWRSRFFFAILGATAI
jgi:hypothetical protein